MCHHAEHRRLHAARCGTIRGMRRVAREQVTIDLERVATNSKVGANVVAVIAHQVGYGSRERSVVTAAEAPARLDLGNNRGRTRRSLVDLVGRSFFWRLARRAVSANDMSTVHLRALRLLTRKGAVQLTLLDGLLQSRGRDEFRTRMVVTSSIEITSNEPETSLGMTSLIGG
jgi:hypothetical protein